MKTFMLISRFIIKGLSFECEYAYREMELKYEKKYSAILSPTRFFYVHGRSYISVTCMNMMYFGIVSYILSSNRLTIDVTSTKGVV